MHKCEYCLKELCTKSALNIHKKSAKYCIQLQGKNITEIEIFICNFCNKEFTLKSSLLKHINICKLSITNDKNKIIENYKEEIENYKKEIDRYKEDSLIKSNEIKNLLIAKREYLNKIEKLENTIAKIAAKPRTTNNTTNNQRYSQIIQNLSPITQETLDELPSKLEDRHISQGAQGYVIFAQENFQDKILCTDIARKKLTFKDEQNNIITDINGKQFTYKLFKTIHGVRGNLVEIKKSKAKTDIEKTQAVLYYGVEDAVIGKFLNMQEDSAFSNKFISELSSKFYIKNIPLSKNSEIEDLEELNENDIEYLVLSDSQE